MVGMIAGATDTTQLSHQLLEVICECVEAMKVKKITIAMASDILAGNC